MGLFVWARRALNGQKRRFPARADRTWPAPAHAGSVTGGLNCPTEASNRKMLLRLIPEVINAHLLQPRWGGSFGLSKKGVTYGGLDYQSITAQEAQQVLDSAAAIARAANCSSAGKLSPVAEIDAPDGRRIARMFPDLFGGAFPHTGDPESDRHWVFGMKSVTFQVGYVSRYVPVALMETPGAAVDAFYQLFYAYGGAALDIKKATGVPGSAPNASVFGNTSYNPAARGAAGAILPSRSVAGYYSSLLPESQSVLRHVLKKSVVGCPLSDVNISMSNETVKRCWAGFKQDLAASGDEFNTTKATILRATFPAAGYLNE
jgi:hypothetical protein